MHLPPSENPQQVKSPSSTSQHLMHIQVMFDCFAVSGFSNSVNCKRVATISSWIQIIYTIVTFVISIWVMDFSDAIYKVDSTMKFWIARVIYTSTILVYFIVFVKTLFSRKCHATIQRDLDKVDKILQESTSIDDVIIVDTRNERKYVTRKYAASFLLVLFLLSTYIVSAWYSRHNNLHRFLLILIFFVPGIGNRIYCIMYSFYVELINIRLQRMHKALTSFQMQQKIVSSTTTNSTAEIQDVTSNNEENPLKTKHILMLRTIYERIWKASTIINDCFGFSLLLTVLLFTLIIVTNLYWLLLSMMGKGQDAYLSSLGRFMTLSISIYSFSFFLLSFVHRKCLSHCS